LDFSDPFDQHNDKPKTLKHDSDPDSDFDPDGGRWGTFAVTIES